MHESPGMPGERPAGLPQRARPLALAAIVALAACGDDEKAAPAAAAETGAAVTAQPQALADTASPAEEASRHERLKARFAEFEVYQRRLTSRFNDLAFELRQRRLAPEAAREATRKMGRAGYLLKLPKGIGAFTTIEDIEREARRLQEAERLLAEVAALAGLNGDER